MQRVVGAAMAVLAAGAAAAQTCGSPAGLMARGAYPDLLLEWTIDPLATGGYAVYRVGDKTLLADLSGEPPRLLVPAAPAFPVVDGDGVSESPPVAYYQVVSLCGTTCVPGRDSDGDRLDDCVETATGVYRGPVDTGTDPGAADSDGDGIDDGDEALGTLAGLDLPGLGASPLRRDVFIEYDWFDDALECAPHSHRPTAAAADRVFQAFAMAPLANRDGSTGISVHQDYGQGGAFVGGNLVAADPLLAGGVEGTAFRGHKARNFAPEREGYFHYALLPHRHDGGSDSSGQAEILGDDLIVSLFCFHSDSNVANTIVHELGHNFGLRHGGAVDCNWKPNYNSVMNYRFQFAGADDDCDAIGNAVLDYSRGEGIVLDENALDESRGACGAPAIDWDGDGQIEAAIAYDLNRQGFSPTAPVDNSFCGAPLTVLVDHDDWAAVNLAATRDADLRPPAIVVDCDNPPPR